MLQCVGDVKERLLTRLKSQKQKRRSKQGDSVAKKVDVNFDECALPKTIYESL